jgi:elongator complex protein 1
MFKHIHRLVKDRSYKEAFVLLRTHKLDMNLLFDLDPEFFLNNTIEVAKSLNSPDYLGLLLQHIEAKTSPWM